MPRRRHFGHLYFELRFRYAFSTPADVIAELILMPIITFVDVFIFCHAAAVIEMMPITLLLLLPDIAAADYRYAILHYAAAIAMPLIFSPLILPLHTLLRHYFR